METEKKYYWIKIKDTFMTSDKVDFLMSQKDGSNYIVLYQMLCLMCLNTDGELSRKIGEIIIPFDVDKIVRDCKYFTKDTVVVALELFKKLGMIYQEEDGCLKISEFENMVGSSKTDEHTKKLNAERQARFRKNHKNESLLEEKNVIVTEEVTDDVTLKRNAESRDKILDIRYISTISLGQQNYAKQVYELWKAAELPCSKDLLYFTQNEFRNALNNLRGINSNDVLAACKNYISTLNDETCYVSNKYWFDSFAESKTFRDYLPDYFDILKFKKFNNSSGIKNNYQQKNFVRNLDDERGWLK